MYFSNKVKAIYTHLILAICASLLMSCSVKTNTDISTDNPSQNQKKLQVLIVDGQNNHSVWPKSSVMMKAMLEQTGKFDVDIYRTLSVWKSGQYANKYPLNDNKIYTEGEPITDPNFAPDFKNYDVVVSNFGWRAASWPHQTQIAFETYMRNGGGFVSVHAANNAFPKWQAYNQMIGLGGWGGRNQDSGPYVYFNDQGELIKDDSKGQGGGHGRQHEFLITIRDTEHPITQGLPDQWMHTSDELYNRLRGPANNMTILASAFDSKEHNGFGRHEPVLMTIDYFKGRVFHTTLGHDTPAFESVGFITTFVRGTQWAASGKVTISIPENFPTASSSSRVVFN